MKLYVTLRIVSILNVAATVTQQQHACHFREVGQKVYF